MASSTQEQQQHQLLPNHYSGATSAPPPTPSTQPNNLFSTSNAADALSLLFNRLPPTLSLPTRRSSSSSATCPPSLSISSLTPIGLLSSVSQLGYFQLTDHSVPSELVHSAESEALALFNLSRDQKESFFPKNWPFGYETGEDDDDDEDDRIAESFRFDSSCSTESSTELALDSLREFARALEKLGLNVIDVLMKALGIENPFENDPTRFNSVMWVSECLPGNKPGLSGGFYPFIVGLQYQIKAQKHSLLSDSGWVSVLPHVDSILVTVGDIAQVWSNGKLKKVRGRPETTLGDKTDDSRCITMSLLITLPTESTVAPLLPKAATGDNNNKDRNEQDEEDDDEERNVGGDGEGENRVFKSFDFEDYAWRVYHERLHFKDPLDRYRVTQKLELPFTN